MRPRALGLACLLAAALPTGAYAQDDEIDFVQTQGALSDEDFYRLVACGAAPGAACTKPFLHWQTLRPLGVRLARIDRAFLGGKQKRAFAALDRAVKYINDTGAAISVKQLRDGGTADIEIFMIDTDGTSPIHGTGIAGVDGTVVTGARVTVWSSTETHEIKHAVIVFGTRLHIRHYESAMLEELTQALGLMTDIRNRHYDGVSIFSQDSNDSKELGAQDVMALRRHYPPGS